MLAKLFTILFVIEKVLSDTHGHSHSSNHTSHSSHRHSDMTLPHCECITGIITATDINCANDQATITEIESLLMSMDCMSTCGNEIMSNDFDLKCNQLFALYIQYHDWCELLTVNETLIHDLLETCSIDCLQEYPYINGAPECDGDINCEMPTMIDHIINTAVSECDPSSCMAYNMSSSINCTEQLQMVEGVHRMCSHHDITENFDEKFDMYIDMWGMCDGIECNVPDTIDVNCSLERNMMITSLPQFVILDMNNLGDSLSPVIAPTMAPTTHDHASHTHSDETLPHCECITGITTATDINCANDQAIITELESLLVSKNCMTKCTHPMGDPEFDFKCNQLFALLIQYHDWCELLTVDETLIHNLWDSCAFDCLQEFPYIPGAPECDGSFNCEMPAMIDMVIDTAVSECNATTCMPINMSSSVNCTEQLRMVEGVHRMCSHEDITENFDDKFDMYIDLWGLCPGIECNVPDTIDVNCSLERNVNITSLPEFEVINLNDLSGTGGGSPDDDSANVPHLIFGLISLFVMIALQ